MRGAPFAERVRQLADDWVADNLDWSPRQEHLFEEMAHETDVLNDEMLQQVFDVGWFNQGVSHDERMAAREWVESYVRDVYDFDFDQYFDWDTWREMYGSSE